MMQFITSMTQPVLPQRCSARREKGRACKHIRFPQLACAQARASGGDSLAPPKGVFFQQADSDTESALIYLFQNIWIR